MLAYVLKRLLLMVPTLLGVLLVTFAVIQFVPGGPVEQYLSEAKAAVGGGRVRRLAAIAASRAWTRSGWSRSRRCTASTSRRTSASCKCWASSPASTWARAFTRTRTSGRWSWKSCRCRSASGCGPSSSATCVAVPLGVAKAVRAGTRFDLVTTLVDPGRLCDSGLRAGRGVAGDLRRRQFVQWFPLRGLTSANWDELSWGGEDRRLSVAHHAAGDGHGVRQLRRDRRC